MGIKTKIALAMATTAVGATLAGAGSFALFTSSATNAGNTFTAGTVVLTDQTANGSVFAGSLHASNMAPGDTEQGSITVKNDGNLDEWVKIDQTATMSSASGQLFTIDANHLTISADTAVVLLHPGDIHAFTVTYSLPLAAGNSYQGQTGTFNVLVDAVQARNNTNTSNNGPIAWN